jgi:hypothetical protein
MALQGTGSAVNGWSRPLYLGAPAAYPITMAAWVKMPAASTTSTGIFGLCGANAMAYMLFYGSDIGGPNGFLFDLYDDTALEASNPFPSPKGPGGYSSDGNWHHIAGQIITNGAPPDGVASGWFWFDGVRVSTTNGGFNLGSQTFTTLQIGVAPTDGTEPAFSTTTSLAEIVVFGHGPTTEQLDPIIAKLAAGANPLRVVGKNRLSAYHPLRNNFQDYGSRRTGFAPIGTPVAPVWVGHPPQVDPAPTTFSAKGFVTHISAALAGTTVSADSATGLLSSAIGLAGTGSSTDTSTGALLASSLQGRSQVSTDTATGFLTSQTHFVGTGASSDAGLGAISGTAIPFIGGAANSSDQGIGSLTIPSIAANAQQLQNALVDSIMRGQPFLPPATWYIALVTQLGDQVTAGIEVSGGNYVRAVVSASLSAWSGTQGPSTTAASNGVSGLVSNNAPIVYPTASADWGTITGYEFWDSAGGGNRWFSGKLGTPLTIHSGETRRFPIASLSIAIG